MTFRKRTVAIEEELRRPRVYPVGVPKRERIIDRDRPDDALLLEAFYVRRTAAFSAGVSGV